MGDKIVKNASVLDKSIKLKEKEKEKEKLK